MKIQKNGNNENIYEHIVFRIKELIMTDHLLEGSKLPSIRSLAKRWNVNPNTVQRAFRILEYDGYIYSVTGKGTFVGSKSKLTIDPAKVRRIKGRIADCYKELIFLGLTPAEAMDAVIESLDLD